MKIAKVRVTTDNLLTQVEKVKTKPKVLAGEVDKLIKNIKDKNKKHVLVGFHDMQVLENDEERAKDCFEVFEDEAALKAKMIHNENIWTQYKFKYEINEETKLRYESFCSGFLYYYDTVLRNGMINHILYCKWDKVEKNDVLTVYLDPKPDRYPLTKAKELEKLKDELNAELENSIYKDGWNPPNVSGFVSDPPSPTGPPPPSA